MRTVKFLVMTTMLAMTASFGAMGCAEGMPPTPSDDPMAQFYRAETVAACVRVCHQEVEANCVNTYPLHREDCDEVCADELSVVADRCMNEFDAWYSCLWGERAYCTGGGVTHGTACDAQYEAVIACI